MLGHRLVLPLIIRAAELPAHHHSTLIWGALQGPDAFSESRVISVPTTPLIVGETVILLMAIEPLLTLESGG
jgi:hypothetical protein